MDEQQLRIFVGIIQHYFEQETGRPAEVGSPYLCDPSQLPVHDFTGVTSRGEPSSRRRESSARIRVPSARVSEPSSRRRESAARIPVPSARTAILSVCATSLSFMAEVINTGAERNPVLDERTVESTAEIHPRWA